MLRKIIILYFALCTVIAHAVTLKSAPSVDRIGVNGVFEWSVTVSGGTKAPKVQLGSFKVVGGPSSSTQISMVNGSVTQSAELVYVLQAPSTPGTYPLPIATLDNQSTPQQNITVVAENTSSTPSGNSQQQNRVNPQHPTQSAGQSAANKSAWIEVSASTKEVFQGERVRVTYRIFFTSARNLQITKLPQGIGFSAEPAREIKEYKVERSERNGRAVNSCLIYDMWVTPSKSGTVEIPPLEAEIEVMQQVQRRNDPFSIFNDPFGMFQDPFMNATPVKVSVASPRQTLSVKGLPTQGRPTGEIWVGAIDVATEIIPNTIPVNQSATLVLTLRGGSILKSLSIPDLKQVTGVEFYPPQSKIFGENEMIRREIRYPLIPRIPGKYELSFEPISIFKPGTGKYQPLISEPLILTGEGGSGGGGSYTYIAKNPTVPASINESLPVPASDYNGTPLLLLQLSQYIGVGCLAFAGFIYYRHRKPSDILSIRNSKKRQLLKKLNELLTDSGSGQGVFQADPFEQYIGELLAILLHAKVERFNHPDQIGETVEPKIEAYRQLWSELRELRYQPEFLVKDDLAAWMKRLRTAIENER